VACGKKQFLSLVSDVPVTSIRRQREQSMAWVAVVLDDFPCFPKASCVVHALHGGEMAADDALRCLHHPLEGLVISSGAAAASGRNAAREDALNSAPVSVCESFCRHAKLLESPQKVVIFDEHTEDHEAGGFLHFISVDVYGGMTPPHDHLLSLVDVEREVAALAPFCQVPDLLSAGSLIIVGDVCRSVGTVCKLKWVQGVRKGGADVGPD